MNVNQSLWLRAARIRPTIAGDFWNTERSDSRDTGRSTDSPALTAVALRGAVETMESSPKMSPSRRMERRISSGGVIFRISTFPRLDDVQLVARLLLAEDHLPVRVDPVQALRLRRGRLLAFRAQRGEQLLGLHRVHAGREPVEVHPQRVHGVREPSLLCEVLGELVQARLAVPCAGLVARGGHQVVVCAQLLREVGDDPAGQLGVGLHALDEPLAAPAPRRCCPSSRRPSPSAAGGRGRR